MSPDKLKSYQANLGYSFKDQALLREALTHGSARAAEPKRSKKTSQTAKSKKTKPEAKLAAAASGIDNERLEFLGDRVLGLVVAELLIGHCPQASEGELALRFNAMVRAETCAEIAEKLDLGSVLRMSQSEESSGGRKKTSILADACEALLGAMFLDGGYEEARRFIRIHWETYLAASSSRPKDAKSALQEWAASQGMGIPKYEEVSRSGPPHNPQFVIKVSLKSLQSAEGTGKSKRASEQEAAAAMLQREGVWDDTES